MMSNHSLIKILKNENKRNLGMYFLAILVFAFCIVIPFVLSVINTFENKHFLVNIGRSIYSEFKTYFGFGIMQMIMTTGFALGIANFTFGYLHKKDEVDFYHSFPITRNEIYLFKYISGILIYLIPYLVVTLISIGFSFMECLKGENVFEFILFAFIINIVYFLLCYSISIFSMMLTGKKIVGFVGSFVLLFFGLVLGTIIQGYYSLFFKTYESITFNQNNLFQKIYNISPIYVYGQIALDFIRTFDGIIEFVNYGFIILISIVIIVIFYFINLLLYKKRRLETCTNSMSFELGKNIIRDVLVVCIGLCGVFIPMIVHQFENTNNIKNLFPSIIWIIVFSIISHAIIEIIYNQDFKMLFNNKCRLCSCIIVALIIFSIFRFDIFGYDKYLPENDEIKEVMVKIDGERVYNMYVFNEETNQYEYVHNQNKDMFDNSHINDEKTINSIKKLIQNKILNDNDIDTNTLRVVWKLKNGKIVNRKYCVDLRKNKEIFNNIFCDINYKKSYIPLLSASEYYRKISVIGIQKSFDIKTEDENKLINALKKDIENFTFLDKVDKYPIGKIVCELGGNTVTTDYTMKDYNYFTQEYPIYESFEDVKSILKEMNIDIYSKLDNVKKLTLMYVNEEKEIVDDNLINIILNNMILSDVTMMNATFSPNNSENFPNSVGIDVNGGYVFYTLKENEETKIFVNN